MEIVHTKKLASHIFRLLKVTEIVFPIGRTNKGNLGLKFTSNNDDFEIMLDAVPLSTKDTLNDDNNIELKRMLEKYWFENKGEITYTTRQDFALPKTILGDKVNTVPETGKKRGRPTGSKNKK